MTTVSGEAVLRSIHQVGPLDVEQQELQPTALQPEASELERVTVVLAFLQRARTGYVTFKS